MCKQNTELDGQVYSHNFDVFVSTSCISRTSVFLQKNNLFTQYHIILAHTYNTEQEFVTVPSSSSLYSTEQEFVFLHIHI